METDPLTAVRRLLETGNNFLVAGHENPDGDALGATAAMGFILQALGKNYRLYGASGVPEQFAWLELPAPLHSELNTLGDFVPDWYLILDCGDPFRMGRELMQAVTPSKIINIDHHLNNPKFGAVDWVDPGQAAVGEMAGQLAKALDIPLSGGLGEAVYLALVTDTGNFSYGNTKPETLELAASIIRQGLDPGDRRHAVRLRRPGRVGAAGQGRTCRHCPARRQARFHQIFLAFAGARRCAAGGPAFQRRRASERCRRPRGRHA